MVNVVSKTGKGKALFRGFSYWLPMAPGILLARRETRT